MNDDSTAQSSSSANQNGNISSDQNQQVTQTQSQQSAPSVTSSVSQSSQPIVAVPHKEHAPVSEHVQVTDPVESRPELHQELKEHGVEVKTDEAHLELTREDQQFIQHSPQSQGVKPVIEKEAKPEFPLTYVQAETDIKKESVWNSIRWLAVSVLRQMKMKKLAGETK